MTIKSFTLYIALGLILLNCETNPKTNPTEIKSIISGKQGKLLDSVLTPYVKQLRTHTDNTAGLAIGVTKGDSIIYVQTFGFENLKRNANADLNTRFHIASVSKPFTAAAVVKLVEQGKLKLDDKIIDFIPEFQMIGDGYRQITIKHILTHTSGIPRHVSENDWLNPKSLEANLDFAKNFELDFEPGTAFNYSNSAFDILGIVINRASGMPFSKYVETQILQPAGMTQSTYEKSIDSLPNHWAAPYSYGLETQEWTPYPHAENYLPSSGLQTTIRDMCKWGILHVNKGSIDGKQIISNEHFELMLTPHFTTPWGDQIGLSWFLQSYLDRPIIMHTGSDTGFEAIMYIYPKEKISITVMANRDFARTGRIINATSEILFGQPPKTYEVSAKYKFAETFKTLGLEKAIENWELMRKDTTDIYTVDSDDILTTGAVLENGKQWTETKQILEYYLSINDSSTYAWRLLGNANLHLHDTLKAIECYEKTLDLNPDYEKGRLALEALKQ